MQARRIQMLAPHHLAGRTLTRYDGPTKTLDLEGGCFVVVYPGDYTARDACMPRSFLVRNPELWKDVTEAWDKTAIRMAQEAFGNSK